MYISPKQNMEDQKEEHIRRVDDFNETMVGKDNEGLLVVLRNQCVLKLPPIERAVVGSDQEHHILLYDVNGERYEFDRRNLSLVTTNMTLAVSATGAVLVD